MPPLLSARTCWIAGWVALVLGLAASFVPFDALLGNDENNGYGDSPFLVVAMVLSRIGYLLMELGLLLVVAAVIVRHVERLPDGPGQQGHEAGVEPPPRDHVDLDEAGDPDLGPGHR